MNQGAKLIFNVEAGTRVTVISYPGYGHYTINGVAHNANDKFSVYFAETTEVVIEATDTAYIYQIIIDPNEEAPEAPTIKEVKVDGMKVDYMVGEELSLEGASVNAIYSDNSIRPITDYSVDSSAVNPAEAGEYDVVFTIGETRITVKVTYVADLLIDETTTIDLSATGAHIEGTTGTYKQLSIDATNGKFADNGSGWTQINAGTIITFEVLAGADVSVYAYQNETNKFDIVIVDGVCTITCLEGGYLGAITVKYAVVYDETTTIDLSKTGAHIEGKIDNYEGLSIDATNGKFSDNGGGWVQVNAGTIITLNVAEGAQVSVGAYQNETNKFDIVIVDGVCTITCLEGGYLNAITVKYAVVYDETTTIDLSATGANIQKTVGEYEGLTIDATNGKFADGGNNWTQVNAGTIITLNVAEGAQVSVTAYSSADNFTIEIVDGVCTITCTGNDYLKAIAVSFE